MGAGVGRGGMGVIVGGGDCGTAANVIYFCF